MGRQAPGSSSSSRYSSSFSAKISPWLAMGCLSPRHMFHQLRQQLPAAPAPVAAAAAQPAVAGSSGQSGLTWLQFELLWRDFFRFITKRYAENGVGQAAGAGQGAAAAAGAAPAAAAPALALA